MRLSKECVCVHALVRNTWEDHGSSKLPRAVTRKRTPVARAAHGVMPLIHTLFCVSARRNDEYDARLVADVQSQYEERLEGRVPESGSRLLEMDRCGYGCALCCSCVS
jgi:hypothetical protein